MKKGLIVCIVFVGVIVLNIVTLFAAPMSSVPKTEWDCYWLLYK